jgi:16S rRNA (cytosine967-C5)-methyltransferase
MARAVAFDLVEAVLDRKRPLDVALEDHPGIAALSDRDRAFARNLVATTLRRLGQIDALVDHCLERPLPRKARPVRTLLRLGVCQLLFLETPAHAAIDTTVSLAQKRGHGPHKALVNAVLRRLSREGRRLLDDQDAARLNTPEWLWESWREAYGEEVCRAIAEAHLGEPPLDLTPREDAAGWAERLQGTELSTGTVRRKSGGSVARLPGFSEGAWWVQDAAAALPAKLLGDLGGLRVIDLCAAPGGKTAQLVLAGARVTAVDRSPKRLERLSANLARLGLEAETVVADATLWRPAEPADAVLVDAPCTATGTIRRHPDIARLKTPDEVAKLAALQARLLAAATEMARPGGTIVYSTCSLQPEEGPAIVEALLASGGPLTRVPVASGEVGGLAQVLTPEGDLRSLPCHLADEGGLDGFYAARLRV